MKSCFVCIFVGKDGLCKSDVDVLCLLAPDANVMG